MKFEVTHKFLTMEPDFARSTAHVLRFLERTRLVRYDAVHIVAEDCLAAGETRFWPEIERGIEENRGALKKLVGELKTAGTMNFVDLLTMPQGFQSKILHTMAHLLDGFFGIDSRFYNLCEDSHWLGESLRSQIDANPEDFWLVTVVGALEPTNHNVVAGLRSFEK